MRALRVTAVVFLAIIVTIAAVVTIWGAVTQLRINAQQRAIESFYVPPTPITGSPGDLIRAEEMTDVDVAGGSVHRILYVSERASGEIAVSSGMVFLPDAPAPADGRKVVAWAHGTLGMGPQCAPSRSQNPLGDMTGWIEQMMGLGWAVAATDYTGLGTPGDEEYLVAQAEVSDVVNSVRALRQFPGADAGSDYVVWGHSQGGHSSLWSGHLAADYAPELTLLGVAAAAPAAELGLILGAQWQGPIAWAIGPEAVIGWRSLDPSLPLEPLLTQRAESIYPDIAEECIAAAALDALARDSLGQQFFEFNPLDSPPWAAVIQQQTVPPMPTDMPVFVAQGTADQVVLAWPNAVLLEKWCAAGSTVSMLWMGEISHQAAAITAGPEAVSWMADRFAGLEAPRTCDSPVPVSIPAS